MVGPVLSVSLIERIWHSESNGENGRNRLAYQLKVLKLGRSKAETDQAAAIEFFNLYASINTTLRAWFIAAGVGGPAFILSKHTIQSKLTEHCALKFTLLLFGLAIALQVGVAVMNKHLNWYLYRYSEKGTMDDHPRLDWWSEQYRVDLWADIVAALAIITGYGALMFLGV